MGLQFFKKLIFGRRAYYLYHFKSGSEQWFFTNINKTMVSSIDLFELTDLFEVDDLFEREWSKSGISHPKILHSTKTNRTDFSLRFPLVNQFARRFLHPIGLHTANVVIFEGDENDPDKQLSPIYRGQVIEGRPNLKAGTMDLVCNRKLIAMDRIGPHTILTHLCGHAVYEPGGLCGLKLEDWLVPMTVAAVDGQTLTINDAALKPDGYYVNGVLGYQGNLEQIDGHEGNQITLATDYLDVGIEVAELGSATVSIAKPCRKSFSYCRDEFQNELNHLGFNRMKDNPLGSGKPVR